MKDESYANNPESIEALKPEIVVVVQEIETQTIEKLLTNWVLESQPVY